MINNNKFEQTYLNMIEQQYHRKPLLGWSTKSFEKTIINMLVKGMKGRFSNKLANEFDNFFVNKSVFSFKDVFKEAPQVTSGGQGKKLRVILTYTYNKPEDIQRLLIGKGPASEGKKGFLKKFTLKKNQQGIIYNRAFSQKFLNMVDDLKISENDQDEESLDQDQGIEESVFTLAYKSIINQANDSNQNTVIAELASKIKENNKSLQLQVILVFNNLEYTEKRKNNIKQFLNPNRVNSFGGYIFLKFNIDGKDYDFMVTDKKDGIVWHQYRTANMDAPTPVKDQLKKVWNHPQQGAGLLGLVAKKIGGGVKDTLFGSMASKTIQQQEIQINFQDEYSMSNMENIAPKVQKGALDKNIVISYIKKQLVKSNIQASNFNCSFDGDKTYFINFFNSNKEKMFTIEIVLG